MFELNEGTAEQLRHLLSHTAWTGFYLAHLEQWREDSITSLLDPSEQRRQTYSDDYLRAFVAVIDSLRAAGPTALRAWDVNAARDQEQQQEDQAFNDAADAGVYHTQP